MKPLHTFTGALALSAALLGAPSPALAQVSDTTRAKVEKLMAEDPAFAKKMEKRYFKGCLDGSNTDALCEKNVSGWYDLYLSEKALATKEQAVAAKEQVGEVADLAIGLVQLGNYVTGGVLPAQNQDLIARIATNPNAGPDLKEFVARVRANPKIGRADREKLLGYLKASIDSFNSVLAKVPEQNRTNKLLTNGLSDLQGMYASLAQSLAKM